MTFGHVRPSKPVWGRTKAEGFRLSFSIVSELLWVRHNIGLAGSLKTVSNMTLSGWRQRGWEGRWAAGGLPESHKVVGSSLPVHLQFLVQKEAPLDEVCEDCAYEGRG